MWTRAYFSLESYFQHENVCGVENLSKWSSEIWSRCWSAPWFLKFLSNVWLNEWMSGWRTSQKSGCWDCVFVSITTFSCGLLRACLHRKFSRNWNIPRIVHSRTTCGSVCNAYSKAADFRRGSTVLLDQLKEEITQVHLERGIVVHSALIDAASLNSLEPFIQLISFCNSSTLIMSSLVMFWFSVNILPKTQSSLIRECSWYEYHEVLALDLPVLREVDLVLVCCEYPSRVWSTSNSWDWVRLINSRMLFSARSALYSFFRISDFASASSCSFCVSKVILILSSSMSWPRLSFLCRPNDGSPRACSN